MQEKTRESSRICSETPRSGQWPIQLPNTGYCAALSPGIRKPRREANHSALSSAELKNEWSYA